MEFIYIWQAGTINSTSLNKMWTFQKMILSVTAKK